jgi:hypothetical protein
MLIPRYTIRWLLGLTTLSAGVSLVLAHAFRGRSWAIGMVAGLWTFVVVAVFFAGAFLLAWLIEQVTAGRQSRRHLGSPFAKQSAEYPYVNSAAPGPADLPPSMTG